MKHIQLSVAIHFSLRTAIVVVLMLWKARMRVQGCKDDESVTVFRVTREIEGRYSSSLSPFASTALCHVSLLGQSSSCIELIV